MATRSCRKDNVSTHTLSEVVQTLKKSELFSGLEDEGIEHILSCLNATEVRRSKGDIIWHPGAPITDLGIVLKGTAHIIQEDYWGNRALLDHVSSGEILGESYAFKENEMFPLTAIAAEDTSLLFIDCGRIVSTCSPSCPFHLGILKNMVVAMANKNIALTQKIEHASKRSLEDKVMSYLSLQALTNRSSKFEIPFSRQELADYLFIDRSSLSRALGNLRDKHLISYQKNHFELLDGSPEAKNAV